MIFFYTLDFQLNMTNYARDFVSNCIVTFY